MAPRPVKSIVTVSIMIIIMVNGTACTTGGAWSSGTDPCLVVGIESAPRSLDPRVGTDKMSYNFARLVYSGLMTRDRRDRLQPDLARSYSWRSPTELVVHLRPGIRFHDGRVLTAADVVATYRAIIEGKIRTAKTAAYRQVAQVKAVNDNTVVFTLKEEYPGFLVNLLQGIVPASSPVMSEHPLPGTGPYRLVDFRTDSFYRFERASTYYGSKPAASCLVFKVLPDETIRWLELRKGTVDIVINGFMPDVLRRVAQSQGLKAIVAPSSTVLYLGLNHRHPALSRYEVRAAIAHAIDRQAIIKALYQGQAIPATGLLHPDHWAAAVITDRYPYDPARSRRLLTRAGFPDPDGNGPQPRLTLTYSTTTNTLGLQLAQIFQAMLSQVGIRLKLKMFEWGTFYYHVTHGSFQVYALRWIGITDPDIYRLVFHTAMTPPNGLNRGFYSNPLLDRRLEAATRSWGQKEKITVYREIQSIAYHDLAYIFLWFEPNIAIMNDKVHGFRFFPNADFVSLAETWKE